MSLRFSTIALALAATPALMAQGTPNKVGVIHIQQAVLSTKDGQKAAQELQAKFDPKRKDIDKKNSEIQQLQEQFRKLQNTATEEQRQKLAREIDQKQNALKRDMEDAQADFDQEREKTLGELGSRLIQVIDKYGRDNAYALILDVSSQQTPVLYIANGVDITAEIVKIYDANAPAPAAPKPTGTTTAPAPTLPKPATPPAVKPSATTPEAPKPAPTKP